MNSYSEPFLIAFPLQAEKFDGEDFQVWKFKITIVLTVYGVEDIIISSTSKPDKSTQPDLYKNWTWRDALVKSILGFSLSDRILKNLLTCTTAAEIWHNLLLSFDTPDTKNALMLMQKFQDTRMGDSESVEEYFERVQGVVDNLKEVGEVVSHWTFIAQILSSLPEKYGAFVRNWCHKNTNSHNIELLKKSLIAEEKKTAQTIQQLKRFKMHSNRGSFILEAFCHQCSSFGHLDRNCPKDNGTCSNTQLLENQQLLNVQTRIVKIEVPSLNNNLDCLQKNRSKITGSHVPISSISNSSMNPVSI